MHHGPFPIGATRCDLGSDLSVLLRSAGSAREAWSIRSELNCEKRFEGTFLVHADTAESVGESSPRFGRVITVICSAPWHGHRNEALKHELLDSPAVLDF